EVFKLLTSITGKPVSATAIPTGTFTFIGPPGKKYTIPEVIDIINGGLLSAPATQKYLLIHGDRKFYLVPADEKPDAVHIPRTLIKELDKRGRTELVQVVVRLKSLDPKELAEELKPRLGPFGAITPMVKAKRVIIQDTAGNLRKIIETLD